jgi:hypothetical protein
MACCIGTQAFQACKSVPSSPHNVHERARLGLALTARNGRSLRGRRSLHWSRSRNRRWSFLPQPRVVAGSPFGFTEAIGHVRIEHSPQIPHGVFEVVMRSLGLVRASRTRLRTIASKIRGILARGLRISRGLHLSRWRGRQDGPESKRSAQCILSRVHCIQGTPPNQSSNPRLQRRARCTSHSSRNHYRACQTKSVVSSCTSLSSRCVVDVCCLYRHAAQGTAELLSLTRC